MTSIKRGRRLLAVAIIAMCCGTVAGQAPEVGRGLSETKIIELILEAREAGSGSRKVKLQRLISYADALVERYPNSPFVDKAKMYKLDALSGLAARQSFYVDQLLEYTEEIACEEPNGTLASENAYYSILGFVYGARLEAMEPDRMLVGTKERYEAFLLDYPNSQRVPVIMASLSRNLIRLKDLERAAYWVEKLEEKAPGTRTASLARGELRRARSLGNSVELRFKPRTGPAIDTSVLKGKVVVLHLWTAWTEEGLSSLNLLARLAKSEHKDSLYLHSINLDRDRKRADVVIKEKSLPWPQSFDKRGFNAPFAIEYAVTSVPTLMVLDSGGVMRYIDSGEGLDAAVSQALAATGDVEKSD